MLRKQMCKKWWCASCTEQQTGKVVGVHARNVLTRPLVNKDVLQSSTVIPNRTLSKNELQGNALIKTADDASEQISVNA